MTKSWTASTNAPKLPIACSPRRKSWSVARRERKANQAFDSRHPVLRASRQLCNLLRARHRHAQHVVLAHAQRLQLFQEGLHRIQNTDASLSAGAFLLAVVGAARQQSLQQALLARKGYDFYVFGGRNCDGLFHQAEGLVVA